VDGEHHEQAMMEFVRASRGAIVGAAAAELAPV
jgi:hypothetical protein